MGLKYSTKNYEDLFVYMVAFGADKNEQKAYLNFKRSKEGAIAVEVRLHSKRYIDRKPVHILTYYRTIKGTVLLYFEKVLAAPGFAIEPWVITEVTKHVENRLRLIK